MTMKLDDDWMVRLLAENKNTMETWPTWRQQEARTRLRGDASEMSAEQTPDESDPSFPIGQGQNA